MEHDEKKMEIAKFIIHLERQGIKFVNNRGETLFRKHATDKEPIFEILHKYIEETPDV